MAHVPEPAPTSGPTRSRPSAMLYIDPDPTRRHLVDAILRGDYVVEPVASMEDLHDDDMELAVIVINLSTATDPKSTWEELRRRWPTVPVVVALSADALAERDHEALWALGPACIAVNPFAPGALRRAVDTALS